LWIPANHINAVPVLVVVVLTLRLAARSGARIDWREIAVAALLLALTVTAYRFVLFWAVAMVPVISRAATGSEDRSAPGDRLSLPVLLPIGLVALLGSLVAPTRFVETLPMAAIERLKQTGTRGTIYADFPYGGPIIDAGYPDWRVAYDGRYYRYSGDEWRYNGGIENGHVPLVDVVRKWRPAAFLLDSRHNAPIAAELARSRNWRLIWNRDGFVVYLPRSRGSMIMPRATPGSAPR
jgi:hypothetical protein